MQEEIDNDPDPEAELRHEDDWYRTTFVSDSARALMNSIDTIFPDQRHIICQWHMNKNIQSRLDKYFGAGEEEQEARHAWMTLWYKVIGAPSRAGFDQLCEELKALEPESVFSTPEDPLPLYSSVYKTYLAGHLKYKIVNFGVARVPHFGVIASSVSENSNSLLKARLSSSQLPIPLVVNAISEIIEEQFENIIITHEKAMINIPEKHTRTGIFRWLAGYISPQAIELIYQQYQVVAATPTVIQKCTGVFRSIYGLPCKHEIQDSLFFKNPLRLWDIHPHWKFDETLPDDIDIPIERRLQEPVHMIRKRRTKRGTVRLDKSGKKRIPSQFEVATAARQKRGQQSYASQTPASRAQASQPQASQGSQVRHNEELQQQIERDSWDKMVEASQREYNEVTAICAEFDPPLSRRDALKEQGIRKGILTRPLEGVLSLAHQKESVTANPPPSTVRSELDQPDIPPLTALLQTEAQTEAEQQSNENLRRGKRQKRPARK